MPKRTPSLNPSSKRYGPSNKGLLVKGRDLVRNYESHVRLWSHCTLCKIADACLPPKGNHVFFRGVLPCQILFIGEAPGPDENVAGFPFVGRAGEMLDSLLEVVQSRLTRLKPKPINFTYAITNTVACLPRPTPRELTKIFNETGRKPNFRAPTENEVLACRPRLLSALSLAAPQAIVFLGSVALEHAAPAVDAAFPPTTDGQRTLPVLHIYHPSYLVRTGGKNSPHFHTTSNTLTTFLTNVLQPK